MLTGQQKLQQLMIALNDIVNEGQRAWPSKEEVRSYLGKKVGRIKKVTPLTGEEVARAAGGRPLVGVDGSVIGYGSGFPHSLYLFRALAASTFSSLDDSITKVDIFYPASPAHRREIEQRLEETATEGREITPEMAVSQIVRERLARLEIEAAIAALKEYNPFLLLLDGGFLRYRELAPGEWEEYRKLSLAKEGFSVGVIEEIGTFDLARDLLAEKGLTPGYSSDREVLFGVFEPGEWLQVYPKVRYKKGYYTCFARPGGHPQAVAYDFFPEHREGVEKIMGLLFSLIPQGGRGIPWWLDQIDRAVRISRREVELLADTCLDRLVRERLFIPQRERRNW
jgi:hypothetical protein